MLILLKGGYAMFYGYFSYLLWMLPAAVACTPIAKKVQLGDSPAATLVKNGVCIVLFAVCLMFCISASFNPFIYFRF